MLCREFMGQGMKAGTYYVVAVALVLVTLPMYRYIFRRSAELSQLHQTAQVAPPRMPTLPPAPVYSAPSHRVRLLKGELCEAGVVVSVQGSSYTELLTGSGRPARCEGRYVLP